MLVGCSDSRVPPELLFGRGLGKLFIVGNAGNTVDIAALGSVEYGVGVLGCPLVVVPGHGGGGGGGGGGEERFLPGRHRRDGPAHHPRRAGSAPLPRRNDVKRLAVVANAKRVAARLKTQSPVVQEAVRRNRLKIVAARYGLGDGHVDWFEDI